MSAGILNQMVMRKHLLDLTIKATQQLSRQHFLLRLTSPTPLPDMLPGQFVELRIDNTPGVMLRRPISIHNIDRENNELWLLVAAVGSGTRWLCSLGRGDTVNCLLSLGNGFSLDKSGEHPLLVGGGVGVAPLYLLGSKLKDNGIEPTFLLGARTAQDLIQIDMFRGLGTVHLTTEDGSAGERGFVTQHSALSDAAYSFIYTCGPKPMMVAVARYAHLAGVQCEASLENMMACGLGACLCCVEKTRHGNLCVCKDGPVFNTESLMWND